MRRVKLAPSLRSERVFRAVLAQLARVKRRGVRVVHYSVQHDHLHLIVEGKDRHDLSAQMQKLFSRIALAVNGVAKRRGSLFRDRHHRVELDGPTKTRSALVYVLFNDRKHCAQNGGAITDEMLSELDDRSSAAWLEDDDWDERARPPPETLARLRARDENVEGLGSPRTAPRTWLAESGWRLRGRGGAIKLHELPRFV
jgi:REP element-mobilizing transposase RayT